MSEQKEVPLLNRVQSQIASAFITEQVDAAQLVAQNGDSLMREVAKELRASTSGLNAIATGDAATYNTHTHVVVPRGEIEALRKDAARYRWLRSPDCIGWDLLCRNHSRKLDEAIDAAIAAQFAGVEVKG